MDVCAIKAPGFGDIRREKLNDLAALTGGVVVDKEELNLALAAASSTDSSTGLTGSANNLSHLQLLGKAKKAIVGRDSTVLLGCRGSKVEIQDRIEDVEYELEAVENEALEEGPGGPDGGS